MQIDQTITAGSIDITGSGAAGGDTLDVDQNLAAGTSLTLDNLQTIAVAQDVDLSAANGDLSATTNVGSITLDGTAGENEIKTTGGNGDIALGAISNTGTASDLIVTTAAGTTSGDITLNGAVTGVGYVTINAGSTSSGNTGDVAINANITAADANGGIGIDIDATNDVTVAGTLTTSDGGTALDIDIDAGNEFTLSSGGIDSDNDVFITATANDVNLATGLTADNEVTIISTSGSVLQTAGNILATDDVNIDAAASSQKIDLAGTIGATTAIGGNVLIGQSVNTSDVEIDGAITADGSVVVDGTTITATANISSDANTDTTGDVDLGATGAISQTGGSINANNGFAKIVSSGSTVSLIDVDAAGANTQATEVTTNGITDNSGVAIQIQGAGDVNVGGIDATNAAGNVEIKSAANIVLNDVDGGATTGTVYLEAGDSITDANGNTANVSANELDAVASNLIGTANDNVLLDPSESGFDALETAVSNLTVVTTAASSDIAINNSIGSTLEVTSAIPDSDGTGALWIKNDNGLTVSAWTLGNDDNIALLATSGNITIPDGGAGVVDASGNLATADISLASSSNTVRLEAAAGIVQDSGSNALVIAANDLLIKTNTLNSETTGIAVGNFGTTDVELAVQLNGKLDIDVNSDTQNVRILGANSSGSATDLDVGDVDGDGNAITTNGGTTKGDLSVTVLNGTSVSSDDSVESSPTLSVFDRINTNNGDISLVVYSGNSQDHGNIQIESGATVQSDGTNDKQGTSTISGDVKVIGQVFANTGESVSIEGADSNIIIDASGVAGSGVLTLAPGAGYDVILEAGANVSVSSGGGNAGNLVIKNARNVTMDATATVVVDGNVDIGHGTVTGGVADSVTGVVQLSNLTLDDNGDGDGANSVGLYVKAGGDVVLVGAIDANADPDNTQLANDVVIVSGGSITNTSGASIAIGEVDDLTLTAVDEIGANGSNITINTENLTASSTGTGDIYILNDPQVLSLVASDNTVTISSISATNGAVSYVQSAHDLSVGGDVSGTGNIIVQSAGDISLNAGDIATTTTGTILVHADSDTNGAGNLIIGTVGSSGDEKIRSGSGTVQLRWRASFIERLFCKDHR